MAIVTLAELKTYFETGDKPTEQQFVNLIDTLASLAVAGSGNANITPITAAALLALPSFSTTTIYIVTDAPYRIAIQAETVSVLSKTAIIIDDLVSGSVNYNLVGNSATPIVINDVDGNQYLGVFPSAMMLGAGSQSNVFYNGSSLTSGTGCSGNVLHHQAAGIQMGNNCEHNVFEQKATSNSIGNNCNQNTFKQYANNNTLGNACIDNIFEAEVNGFIFDDNLQYVTVEAGAVGADYTLSPFLYGNSYPSRIFFDGTDNFHEYIDTTVPQIVLTNLNTGITTYIGSGGGDLQTVTTAGNTTTTEIISQTVGVGKVRLDPNGALEINTGWSSAYLRATNVVSSDCDFEFPDYGPGTETLAMQSDLASYLPLTGGSLSGALNEAQGANIASATTTDIGAATGNSLTVTGTTTITGLGTVQAGTRRIVTFSGILILTHNGTSLILPTAANITTAVGDVATFVSLGSGNWFCASYQRASGAALVGGGTDTQVVLTGSDLLATVNDSASYHFGTQFAVMGGTAAQRTFKFTDAKTVTKASLSLFQTVNGSGETVNIFLRNETAGTDTAIGTFTSNFGASTALKTLYTGLSIAVNTTDDYCIKITTPAFATNPTNWIPSVLLSLT